MTSRRPRSAVPPERLLGCSLAALALVAVASSACASRHSVDALRRQIDQLQRDNFQLRKDLTEARVRLQMQDEGATQPAGAPPDARPAGDERGQAPLEETRAATGPRVVYSEPITDASRYTSGPGAAPGSSVPSRLMRSARERLDARDPEAALAFFRQVAERHSDDSLADDAQFGAGECYFQMGRYDDAIAEYRKVVNNFPFGDQVPFAFLKIGFAHLAQENRDLAMDSFKTVSEAYPGTEAATVARQQIAHLKASSR